MFIEILCYPTPINFNYWYGIGLLLVFLLVNQVLTGIQVGSYYIVSIDVALSSVDYLMREITYGWSFRYLHSNGVIDHFCYNPLRTIFSIVNNYNFKLVL